MAKRKDQKLDYSALLRELKRDGPGKLYLIWGPEDYLRDNFLGELRAARMPGGVNEFDDKRLDGPQPAPEELSQALDAMPFLGGGVFVELRDFDINRCREEAAREIAALFENIPDYCTVAVTLPPGSEPDGRLSLVKLCRQLGREVEFTAQGRDQILGWVSRRFSALGKKIDRVAAERLVFLSGSLMGGLIPEIEKIAAYAPGDAVTAADVEAAAHHIPEADVFEMTEKLSQGDCDGAARYLAELLAGNENPVALLSILGIQMRRLYAARLAQEKKLGPDFLKEITGISYDSILRRLQAGARRYTLPELAEAVSLCAETDYLMKSSAADDEELLMVLVLRLAFAGGSV
jgi:DNA polymerase-3 subunit delta